MLTPTAPCPFESPKIMPVHFGQAIVSSNIHIKYWPRIERLYVFRTPPNDSNFNLQNVDGARYLMIFRHFWALSAHF